MRGRQSWVLVALLALIVALVAAGCGDDDDDDGDGATAITKEEWIAQANEICQSGDRELEEAAEEAFGEAQGGGESDQQAEQRFLEDVLVPNIEQQVDGIAALPRPEGDEEEIEEIVTAAQEGVETLRADPSAIEGESDPFAEPTRLMTEYGVTGCG